MSPTNYILRKRCPHCKGNLTLSDTMEQGVRLKIVSCLMCTREIRPAEIFGIHGNLVSRAVPVPNPHKKSYAFQRV